MEIQMRIQDDRAAGKLAYPGFAAGSRQGLRPSGASGVEVRPVCPGVTFLWHPGSYGAPPCEHGARGGHYHQHPGKYEERG
ncbi:hypothetical protein ES703_124551 [subsurface metagenome]